MVKVIEAEKIQKKFAEIINVFVNSFKDNDIFSEDKIILEILLLKISSNVDAANILCTNRRPYEAKIIIRSAFESQVLLEFLIHHPEKINEYKYETQISNFKDCFALYKRKFMSENIISKCFDQLDKNLQEELLTVKKGNTSKIFRLDLIEKNLRNRKFKFQDIRKLIDILRKIKSPVAEMLYLNLFDIYGRNSQISHGEWGPVYKYFVEKSNDKKEHEEIIDCFRQLIYIISYTRESIKQLNIISNNIELRDKIIDFCEYTNYNSLLESMKKQIKPTSDILEIITYN